MTCGKRLLIGIVAALAVAGPAYAIIGGSPDGTGHPAVGLVAADNGEICSGALVTPQVFVTAAHCFTGAGPVVALSFDPQVTSPPHILGVATADPQFGTDKSDSHDIAVVRLLAPVTDPAILANLLKLPAQGVLDQQGLRAAAFTGVGYGITDAKIGAAGFDGLRRVETSSFTNAKPTELRLAQNPGGVCFGDSGGPRLLGTTIVAITSSGNKNCTGQSLNYRLDSPSARSFLAQFVAVP